MRAGPFPYREIAVIIAIAGAALSIRTGFAKSEESRRDPPCDVDCVSRDAGYAWGRELGINDPSQCGGNSKDFIAGCEAYATSHEDPMVKPADDSQTDQASDDEQDKLDGMTVDGNVDVLTGPSADPDANLPLPSEAPDAH